MSINNVVVCGNLTRDAELRSTNTGSSVLVFGIAVNDHVKNQNGEWEDRPNFFDCVMFGSRANSLHQYLTKGLKLVVQGRLRYNSWEKDGQRRSKVEIVAEEIEFASSRGSSGGNSNYAGNSSYGTSQPSAAAYGANNNPQYAGNVATSSNQGGIYSGSYATYGASGSAPSAAQNANSQTAQYTNGVQYSNTTSPSQAVSSGGEGDAVAASAPAPAASGGSSVYDEDIPF